MMTASKRRKAHKACRVIYLLTAIVFVMLAFPSPSVSPAMVSAAKNGGPTRDMMLIFSDDFQDGDFTQDPAWSEDNLDDGGVAEIFKDGNNYMVRLRPDSDDTDVENIYLKSEVISFTGTLTVEFDYILLGIEDYQGDRAVLDVWGMWSGFQSPDWKGVWNSTTNTGQSLVHVSLPLTGLQGPGNITLKFGFTANYYRSNDPGRDRFYIDNVMVYENTNPVNNTPPPTPNLKSPGNGADVKTLNPTLEWYGVVDADGDSVTYDVEVDTVAGDFSSPVFHASTISATQVTVSSALSEGSTYQWHVRAYDGIDYSPWSDVWTFSVVSNSPPTVPVPIDPTGGESVMTRSPILEWSESTDSDGDPVSYQVQVRGEGETWSYPIYEAEGITNTTHKVDVTLMNGYTYYWHVRAYDGNAYSDWSAEESFFVVANTPPDPPTFINPTKTSNKTPVISWGGYGDINGDKLTFFVRIGTTPNGSEILPYTHVNTSHINISTPLNPGRYYVGIIANDSLSNSTEFVGNIDIQNLPPKPPTNLNPTQLSLKYQVLEWSGASDPDGDPIDHYNLAVKKVDVTVLELTLNESEVDLIGGGHSLGLGDFTVNISAVDPYGAQSSWFSASISVVENLPPLPPTNLLQTAFSTTNVTLAWSGASDPDGDNLSYWLRIVLGTRTYLPWTHVANAEKNLRDFLINGNYTVYIYSNDGIVNSTEPFIGDFSVDGVNLPPAPPSGLHPTQTHEQRPTIMWNASRDPEGDEVTYLIKISSGGEDIVPWISVGPNLTYTPDIDLDYGSYVVSLRATDGDNPSDIYTATINITPIPNNPPVWDTGSIEVENTGTDIVITWPEAHDPEGGDVAYSIEVLPVSPGASIINNQSTKGNSFTLPVDFREGDYMVRVFASDGVNTVFIEKELSIPGRIYSVSVSLKPQTLNVAPGDSGVAYLEMRNDGNMDTVVSVNLENALWLYATVKEGDRVIGPWSFNVALKVNDVKNISLRFTLPEETKDGNYSVMISYSYNGVGNVVKNALDLIIVVRSGGGVEGAEDTPPIEKLISNPIYCFAALIILIIIAATASWIYLSRQERARVEKKVSGTPRSPSKTSPRPTTRAGHKASPNTKAIGGEGGIGSGVGVGGGAVYDNAPVYMEPGGSAALSPMYIYETPRTHNTPSAPAPMDQPAISQTPGPKYENVERVSEAEVEVYGPPEGQSPHSKPHTGKTGEIIDITPVKEEIKK